MRTASGRGGGRGGTGHAHRAATAVAGGAARVMPTAPRPPWRADGSDLERAAHRAVSWRRRSDEDPPGDHAEAQVVPVPQREALTGGEVIARVVAQHHEGHGDARV